MREEIYAIAAAIASPSAEEADILELLCDAAEAELAASLRPGIAAADCRAETKRRRRPLLRRRRRGNRPPCRIPQAATLPLLYCRL